MNLLIIPSWYSSKNAPLNGIFFKELAVALSRRGHNVTLIDVSFHGRHDLFNLNNFHLTYQNDEGVHVYALKMPSFYLLSRISFIQIAIFKMLLFFVFRKLSKKENKFDIIHAHSFYPAGYCACKLSEQYKIPLVVTEHSSGVLNKIYKGEKLHLLKYTVNHCNKFICVSSALKQSICSQIKTNKKLIVIPNMYSSIFSYSNFRKKNNEFVFFSIGSFINSKRHILTVSCFDKAFKDKSNVKLRIAGSGELYGILHKQIHENNLSEKIQLLGLLNRKQIKNELDNCDSFILASAYETFGIVYIEAMACGKPVITARNGGANDIINETNGILVDVDNKEQLVKAFQYMYQNADKYDSKKIAADCYAKYSEDAVVKQLSDIYKEIQSN